MAHLPPVTWNEVATKDDLRATEVALRNDIDAAVGRLGTQLRAEMHVLGADLRTEFVEVTTVKRLVTFVAAWTTVLLTAARLIS